MRWTWIGVAACAAIVASFALAQEAPKYEDLKKQYDAAKASLEAAQDAKNALGKEKDELTKQVAALQKQLNEVTRERDDLARQAASQAERTYQLRANLAAWQEFMKKYPALHAKWKVFLETELLKPANEPPALPEPTWPFRVAG
jgi:predicted nuclease with TOPRIM domain